MLVEGAEHGLRMRETGCLDDEFFVKRPASHSPCCVIGKRDLEDFAKQKALRLLDGEVAGMEVRDLPRGRNRGIRRIDQIPEQIRVAVDRSGPTVGITRAGFELEFHLETAAFGSREVRGGDVKSGRLDPVNSVKEGAPKFGLGGCHFDADGRNRE